MARASPRVRLPLLLACCLGVARTALACAQVGTTLKAISPLRTQEAKAEWDPKEGQFKVAQEVSWEAPVSYNRQHLRIDTHNERIDDVDKQVACMWSLRPDICRQNSPDLTFPGIFTQACIPAQNGERNGTRRQTFVRGPTKENGCQVTVGTLQIWRLNKTGPDVVQVSYMLEVQRSACGTTTKVTRTERIDYAVTNGCLLTAKPANCAGGGDGADTLKLCQPCKDGTTPRLWPDDKRSLYCSEKWALCDLADPAFTACPVGTQTGRLGVFKVGRKDMAAVNCSLCPPHTYNSMWPENGASQATCAPCGDWQQAPNWGSVQCDGCKAGTYPTRRTAPLDCRPCPPGSFSNDNEKSCTRCPGKFYSDKPGAAYCTRCPTDWMCLPGMASQTPYRWDKSGNPSCLSRDGRVCWEDGSSCGDKLKAGPGLLKAGKMKELICGEQHKKVWGSTGYDTPGHWCIAAKQAFMEPGKEGVGATNCAEAESGRLLHLGSAFEDVEALQACQGRGCTCKM